MNNTTFISLKTPFSRKPDNYNALIYSKYALGVAQASGKYMSPYDAAVLKEQDTETVIEQLFPPEFGLGKFSPKMITGLVKAGFHCVPIETADDSIPMYCATDERFKIAVSAPLEADAWILWVNEVKIYCAWLEEQKLSLEKERLEDLFFIREYFISNE